MYVSTNRLRVSKGRGPALEERFIPRGGVEQNPGYLDFELWKATKENYIAEYLVVTLCGS